MGTCGNDSTIEDEKNIKKSMPNMLKFIKSSHMVNKIFSYLNEIRKLNLVRHNNYFQNILSINIEYYMKMSGRYKVEGINGNGKEYEIITDELLFEGEYLNGKRHGKGKEYNSKGKLKYEGDYLFDKKWNGKEYDKNNMIINILNKGTGKIRRYNSDEQLNYECDYINGQENGIKKQYHGNKLIYEGNIINSKENGKIKRYNNNGILIFEGEYSNGKINGKVKEYYNIAKLKFEGEYSNGEKNGKGKEYNYSGYLIFEGEYLFGQKWNGNTYDEKGNIIYQLNNGKGKVKEYDDFGKLKYEIEYLNGQFNKKEKEYYPNGNLHIEKELINNKVNGYKREYHPNGNLRYEEKYDWLSGPIRETSKNYDYKGNLKK